MTLEEFLERSASCACIDELGALFVQAVEAAGYQNVAFVRIANDGFVDLPYLQMPDQFVGAYLQSRCEEADPVLVQATRTTQPFHWNDIPQIRELTRGEKRTVSVCRDVGVHSGMSIPFHGPDGVMDLIGVSLRDEKKQDRQATGKILALASVMRWRYWQLQNALPLTEPRCPDVHVGGPDGMSNAQCRALVLVDMAQARRRMGLPQLSHTLNSHVAEADLEQLLSWGLVVEVPDDTSFRYHLAASPLGQHHLQTCVVARIFRRKAWSADVPRNEAPQIKV